MQKIQNYINGELVAPISGEYLENYNPATGAVYSLIPDSDEKDVDNAVKAAKEAFPSWSNMAKQKRAAILIRLIELIQANLDKFALAASVDKGKPVWLAQSGDMPRAVSNLHFYATSALHCHT